MAILIWNGFSLLPILDSNSHARVSEELTIIKPLCDLEQNTSLTSGENDGVRIAIDDIGENIKNSSSSPFRSIGNEVPFDNNTKSEKYRNFHHIEKAISELESIVDLNHKNENGAIKTDRANLPKILTLPWRYFKPAAIEKMIFNIPIRSGRKKKRIEPKKLPNPFLELNYFAGIPHSNATLSNQDIRYIDFGKPYFSSGLSLSYNRFITSRIYAKIILSADKTIMKYSDRIARDTLVPTSAGEQIIKFNEYLNGVVDTESGIPMVQGVYNRDVINLNRISSLSFGVGFGINQPIGRWNVNFEIEAQRSLLYDLSGLGREESSLYIKDLKSADQYFPTNPKNILNANLKSEYALTKSILITGGIQYQKGMTSILTKESGRIDKINLIRANLGIKKIL